MDQFQQVLGRSLKLKKGSPDVKYLQTVLSPLPCFQACRENGAFFFFLKKMSLSSSSHSLLVPKMSQAFSLPTCRLFAAWQLITQVIIHALVFVYSTKTCTCHRPFPGWYSIALGSHKQMRLSSVAPG